jgi:hypothetical protein
MAKVDPKPPPDELRRRRKPRFIINPTDVKPNESDRVRQWAREIVKKMDDAGRLSTSKVRPNQIIARDGVDAEDIDIRQIYPFPDLNWIVYRKGKSNIWALMLRSRGVILAEVAFAQI